MTWTAACVVLSIAAGVSALLALLLNGARRSRGVETAIGLLTALAAATALAAVVCLVMAPTSVTPWWLWCAAAIATLAAVAKDWSRKWMVGAAVLFLVGAVVVIGRHGYVDLDRRAAIARYEQVQDADLERARLALADARRVTTAVGAVAPAVTAARNALAGAAGVPTTTSLLAAAGSIIGAAGPGVNPDVTAWNAATSQVVDTTTNRGTVALIDAVDSLLGALAASRSDAAPSEDVRARVAAAASSAGAGGLVWASDHRALAAELADYRFRVTGSDADKKARDAAVASAADPGDPEPAVSWQDAISAGPSAIVASWSDAVARSDPRDGLPGLDRHSAEFRELTDWLAGPGRMQRLVPGNLGWAAVGVLLLSLWVYLLAMNGRQLPGPVSLPDAKDGDVLLSTTRVAVLHNVTEPGATPGSAANNPVTNLLELAGIPVAGGVGMFLTKLVGITGKARGYAVTYERRLTVSTAAKGSGAKTEDAPVTALFQVCNLVSGRVIATTLLAANDEAQLGTRGGLWAAGVVLGRSTRIPSWASWSPNTGAAIGQAQTETNLAALQTALRGAPGSGLLLVKAGNLLETEGRVVEAIEMYARAVTASPRYFVARYRLAASIGSLRHEQVRANLPSAAACQAATRWVASATAAQRRRGRTSSTVTIDPATSSSGATMEQASYELFDNLTHDVTRRQIVRSALRRSERSYLLGLLTGRGRARFSLAVEAARAAVTVGPIPPGLIRRVLADRRREWQACYNLACAQASKNAPAPPLTAPQEGAAAPMRETRSSMPIGPGDLRLALTTPLAAGGEPTTRGAMDTLLRCLSRSGVEQLDAKWAQADPDLRPLRADQDTAPLFAYFIDALGKE